MSLESKIKNEQQRIREHVKKVKRNTATIVHGIDDVSRKNAEIKQLKSFATVSRKLKKPQHIKSKWSKESALKALAPYRKHKNKLRSIDEKNKKERVDAARAKLAARKPIAIRNRRVAAIKANRQARKKRIITKNIIRKAGHNKGKLGVATAIGATAIGYINSKRNKGRFE